MKWKHFTRYWPFVRGIHPSSVNSPYKGQWCAALIFLWSAPEQTVEEAIDLEHHRAQYDVIVMHGIVSVHLFGLNFGTDMSNGDSLTH